MFLFGGCIGSWKQSNGNEVLYMRPDAVFDKSKPISGGVPLCFPQFGPGEMQQHGFARNLDWAVGSASADLQADERDPTIELVLTENDYTLKMWPHKFKAVRFRADGASLLPFVRGRRTRRRRRAAPRSASRLAGDSTTHPSLALALTSCLHPLAHTLPRPSPKPQATPSPAGKVFPFPIKP